LTYDHVPSGAEARSLTVSMQAWKACSTHSGIILAKNEPL